MPFQKGNTLAAKSKVFDQALRRAIAQDDGKRVRAAAEQLLDQAAAGEQWAIQHLADRLDGKPGASVDVTVTKRVEDLTLDELVSEIAAARSGSAAAVGSAPLPGEVH